MEASDSGCMVWISGALTGTAAPGRRPSRDCSIATLVARAPQRPGNVWRRPAKACYQRRFQQEEIPRRFPGVDLARGLAEKVGYLKHGETYRFAPVKAAR
ncbi:hypothetical protein GCM10007387_28190 [Pseudoduganella albidiflava]|uniref:Uncharacterized protein n=1 Tax=Pseudoduganella albidiflava TaxID=321983 RepID=A0AA87XX20_9BURK|nr:hypothetical protein GCM10007387_28190 [Pseudoduganella albidiflava]